jgi:penicillin-binding protein 1A
MPRPPSTSTAATKPRGAAGGRAKPLKSVAPSGKRRWARRALSVLFILLVWSCLAAGLMVLWFARDLPRPEAALDAFRRPSLTLQDRSGQVVATFGDLVGEPLRLSDLPPALPAAVVAVEDRRFWRHYGIDPIGLARAIWVNVASGRVAQGGSTITQQVAKTLFLSNARTVERKVQELLLTIWLERTFTKREILEIYLNRVYLGAGAWGVDAGARQFFNESARKVNLWQSAVLAGLPRAPSRFNPRVNAAAAAARGKVVLAAMADTGAITSTQAALAGAQIAFPRNTRGSAGWFADWAAEKAQAIVQPGSDAILRTTLDSRLQTLAETKLAAMLGGAGAAANVGQGAIVILDAPTGAVRAMVGGRDFRESPYNRALLSRRQPGSAFKPFVWLAALEKGMRPDDMVLDAPVTIGAWSPANFDRRFQGEVTLETALAESINTASVRLLLQAGGPRIVAAVAARLGIGDVLPNNASIALGTGEVGLLELTASYAAFFNGGRRVTPGAFDRSAVALTVAIDPEQAAMMARMLGAVVARGSGRAAAIPGRRVAGKTGTTQDFHDAWFIGCVDNSMIGIWLGNDDNQAMKGVVGSGLPAKLFRDIALEMR